MDSAAGIYTETLARLYLQQGFVEEALAIYRHLVQEQPANQALQARLRTLEQQVALAAAAPDVAATLPTPDATGPQAPQAPRSRAPAVVAQLERWLLYLQRQRQAREGTAHGMR
jgi:hypothetical protein